MEEIKIVSVEKKKRYYLVTTTEDDYKFDEDIIIKYHVFKGSSFSKNEFEKIVESAQEASYYTMAIRYLSYGARSRSEMAKYLTSKGCEKTKKTLDRLENDGYINDNRLVNDLLSYYKETKKGPLYISKKMKEKGLSDELIKEVTSSYSYIEEEEKAKEIACKELQKVKSYPIRKQKEKIYSLLINRGFSFEIASRAIGSCDFVDESSERLSRDYENLMDKLSRKELSNEEKKKWIVEHLISKGYEYSKIKEIIE